MSVNKAIVIGNLGRDPEIRALPSGQNVANFSLATTARFKDRNGDEAEADRMASVVAFGKLADTCQQFLSKGRQVYVEGRLTTRQYEAKDGSGNATGPKSSRCKCACSAIAATPTRQGGSIRRHPVLIPTTRRESRESGSLPQLSKSQSETTEMDIYAIVTDKIINLLEQGVVPWRRPWTSAGLPRNLVSKKPYRGINHFLLSASKYVSPFWLTMRQANELGGHVRKGEESTIVVFWKVDDAKQSTEDLDTEREQREEAPPIPSAILSRFQPRTMRTAANSAR